MSKGEKLNIVPKKKVQIGTNVVQTYLSYFMGWDTCHSNVTGIILEYTIIQRSKYGRFNPGGEGEIIMSHQEIAEWLLRLYPLVMNIIKTNNFDIYVKCSTCLLSNLDQGHNWFLSLEPSLRMKLFTDYSLDELTKYLCLS